ncbi:Na+/H+ antiporter subunit C [Bartonella sp. DGB1]|uniref:Na+/H+ antiporter subunit C n=1 Tax=Bartonella sp. DGB1 TaxID=3239807 RepID=UPI0035269881
MEFALSLIIGSIFSGGIWLILRSNTYQVILGVSLLSHAVNLFIFCCQGIKSRASVIVSSEKITNLSEYIDPVPQSLVLTAIVINFSMTALIFLIFIFVKSYLRTENVDGRNDE